AGGHFWLSETPEKAGSKSWDSSLPRIASWVKLKDAKAASAKPILFINTHFDHKGETARLEAAKLIRAKIAELGSDCSVIVTGDFNAGEASPPYAAFFGPSGEQAAAVVDSFRVAHPERTAEEGTFNGFKAGTNTGARIDWIGVSRDWTVVSAVINRVVRDGRTPSDHYPIAVELTR
ncbi:MAG TPA: endonuclease/exonuclease/phosphatase family protein, partial [Pirellulales bacterium]